MKRALLSTVLLFVAACGTNVEDEQGKSCQTAADCRSPYTCVQTRPSLRTCELLPLPKTTTIGEVQTEDAGQPYYCAEVSAVFNQYCVSSCHGAVRTGSGQQPFRMDYYDPPDDGGLPGAHQMAADIKIRTYDQRNMPPPGSPAPSDAQRLLIRNWVALGAPFCNDAGM